MSQIQVPKGWELIKLDDICTQIYRYPTYYNIKYVEHGIPEIRGTLIKNGSLDSDLRNYRFITKESSKKFPRTIVQEGDIVMTVRGTMGKIGLVPKELAGANITANLMRIALDKDRCTPQFIKYFFLSPLFRNEIQKRSSNTTITTIQAPKLKSITVPLPSLLIQKKIVQKLDYILGQLEEKKKTIGKLYETNKNNLNYLLEHSDSILISKLIPVKDFEKNSTIIADILESKLQGLYYNRGYFDDGIPLLRITDMNNDGKINYDSAPKIHTTNNELRRFSLQKDDILVARTGGAGKAVIFDREDFPMLFAGYLIRFRIKKDTDPFFVLLCLRHSVNQSTLLKMIHGSSNKNINAENIKKLRIPSYKKELQQKIVNMYNQMNKEVLEIKQKLEIILIHHSKSFVHLHALEKSILDKAFSGNLN